MERRNRSLEALQELRYIDTIEEDEIRGKSLINWVKKYLESDEFLTDLDLTLVELENFSELFYKNINFLKEQKDYLKTQLNTTNQIKKFFN